MAILHVLCFLLLLNYVIPEGDFTPEENLIADKVVSSLHLLQSVIDTANTTLLSMKSIQSNLIISTQTVIEKNEKDISLQISALRKNVSSLRSKRSKTILDRCIDDEQPIDILVEAISDEIKQCITVALAENVNIISNCIVEAQTFMDLPTKVAADLQTCGGSKQCLLALSIDAVNESMEIPSKVLVLTARVQQLAYHALSNINGCAVNGLINVVKQGIAVVEDIVACIKMNY
ncbi:uncharacterized protein LOC123314832 [Coccinella septempunctata]|uniref:uncharacterized protein LOC123314832 n=1 Tax=Coccinella septempunctata TaxID=41139 RepID=UPI001D060F99|nr:uncharacterized protein LOC123314832 [Coccinella septempunctata]